MKNLQATLALHPFLKGMKPEHLAILARHAREAEFKKDQVIFRQNENANEFYLILHGKVAVESYVARADDIPLQTISDGDVLGWSWLFPPFTWHFQARALQTSQAIFIDGSSLLVACEQVPDFGFLFMQRIAQVVINRLGSAQRRLLEIQKIAGNLPGVDEPQRRGTSLVEDGNTLEDSLAKHPFLAGLKEEYLKILASAAMKANFDEGEVIFREGDPANRLYLILQGKVALETRETKKDAATFQMIGDGDVLGWSWMFPPFYSHFGARVLEPTQSIFLYGTRLREESERNHQFGYALTKRTVAVVIKRLQATRARLIEISALKDLGAPNPALV